MTQLDGGLAWASGFYVQAREGTWEWLGHRVVLYSVALWVPGGFVSCEVGLVEGLVASDKRVEWRG